MSPSSPCSPFAFPHLSPFLRGLTLPRLSASVKAAELWALGLCVLEGLDGCRMQTAQVPNTSSTNQGCQHPAPASLSEGAGSSMPCPQGSAGSLLLSPFLQGGLLQAGACQLLPFQPPHSDFGDSADVCCFPIPCVLRWDLSCTAEDDFGCWGSSRMGHQTNQALLSPYGHVSFLFHPCVLPVHRLRYPLAECNYPSSSPSPSSGWLLPSSEFCIVPLELATKANNNKIC